MTEEHKRVLKKCKETLESIQYIKPDECAEIDKKTFTEVAYVIEQCGKFVTDKLPQPLTDALHRLSDESLLSEDFNHKKMSYDSLVMFSALNLVYLCDSDEEREELMNIYDRNEKKRQLESYKKMLDEEGADD